MCAGSAGEETRKAAAAPAGTVEEIRAGGRRSQGADDEPDGHFGEAGRATRTPMRWRKTHSNAVPDGGYPV